MKLRVKCPPQRFEIIVSCLHVIILFEILILKTCFPSSPCPSSVKLVKHSDAEGVIYVIY